MSTPRTVSCQAKTARSRELMGGPWGVVSEVQVAGLRFDDDGFALALVAGEG